MDNYNNIMNQQYGNIVYGNNMMQPNMPMQQNAPLIQENTQHNIQNDSRLPPNLMEPRGMQMVGENANMTNDSMRIADNTMDRVQNSYGQSSGNGGYNSNYVANMSTNENNMQNINVSESKLHDNVMTDVHAQHIHDDKYKHTDENIGSLITEQEYQPPMPPEESQPVIDEPPLEKTSETDEEYKEKVISDKIQSEISGVVENEENDINKTEEDSLVVQESKEDTELNKIDDNDISKSISEENDNKESVQAEPDTETVQPSSECAELELDDKKEVQELPTEEIAETKTEETADYGSMCRVCLKTGLADLTDLCSEDGAVKILDKVMLCASVQIAKNDGLPCHICESCVSKLHVAYDFKITCESSDVELRKRLNIAVPKTVVKTEFVLIECDDQDYNLDESEHEKPRSKRKYKEDSEEYLVSDSAEDSGSDSSFSLNKPKSKKKSKRRTRSTSKRMLPKRGRKPKDWDHEISTPESSRKRTKYIVDPDDDKPLITIKKIKSDEQSSKHACEICNKTFPYLSFLKQHMLTHQDKDTIIKCKFCTAKFTNREDYKQHTLDYHAEDLDEDYPIVTPKEKKYKKSLDKSELKEEKRTPRERKGHKCPYCDIICATAIKLTAHKRTHVGEKPFVCHICQKPFKQTVSLEAHIKRHTEDKSLQCEHCQKICASKSDLNRHIKTDHMDNKHFECAICNKEFPTKVKLDKHVLKHEKEDEELSAKENKEKKTPSTKDLFKSIAPITSTYWSDSYSD